MLGGLGFVSQPVRICLQLGSGICYLHCFAFASFFVYPPVCVVHGRKPAVTDHPELGQASDCALGIYRGKSNLLFIPDSWRWDK